MLAAIALFIALLPLGGIAIEAFTAGEHAHLDMSEPASEADPTLALAEAADSDEIDEETHSPSLDDDLLHDQPLVCPPGHRIVWSPAATLHDRRGRVPLRGTRPPRA
ncbi:Hypothetical protein I5071_64230 [Sandaracinus amylolyticus]|nr:Hypothetical protein I5071_64230 [Sandaracinus amylolyticus]